LYAILDIETTGGAFNKERITEISIYRYDGHDIVDRFESLMNPERKIQHFVVKLTGITDKMVKRAPKFHELAKRIVEITDDCILVAHNSDFDYRVLRNEYKSLGYNFIKDTLCTVELSKELLPDIPYYNLDKLCKSLGIPISNRHRADGDAFATVKLFELLLQKDKEKKIITANIKNSTQLVKKERLADAIASIPARTGVFYLHQENGRIMYMAKAPNMRKKIGHLFSKKSKKALQIRNKMFSVSFDETGNFTIASLLFNIEIAKHKPRYNSDFFKHAKPITFAHPDMILLFRGRHTGERSVIYIKNDELIGYTYTDLEYQFTNLEVLQNKLTIIPNNLENRFIVKTSLKGNHAEKIIRL